MYHEYSQVVLERRDDDGGRYYVFGLPEGANFKREDSYVQHTAPWLKVDGVGFAAPAAELSQHGRTLTLKQEREGGPIDILTRPPEDGETADATADATA